MGLEIEIVSRSKGSNHGGCCLIKEENIDVPMSYYIKHCSGSRIRKGESSLNPFHQPIYEAITCEMAQRLGLNTSNFYVLLNLKKNLIFISKGELKSNIKSKQPFYFASELLIPSKDEDFGKVKKIIEEETFYRDILMISDIVGRKQNYFYDSFSENIFYIDLGCNFVDAHENFIELKHHHKPPLAKKELKNALKFLKKYSIKTNCKKGPISLIDFVNLPREMSILTMNPRKNVRLDKLISEDEIEEIIGRIISGLYFGKQLKRKNNPYLIRN